MSLSRPSSVYLKSLEKHRQASFELHCKFALTQIINPLFKKFSCNYSGTGNLFTAIIVEDRPSYLLRFSVLNMLVMTRLRASVKIITTEASLESVRNLFTDVREYVYIEALESGKCLDSLDVGQYNNLLKNPRFWMEIPSEKILIFQTDALIIDKFREEFLRFDFIGSPWVRSETWTAFPVYGEGANGALETMKIIIKIDTLPKLSEIHNNNENACEIGAIGNGGFSVRSRSKMIEICNSCVTSEEEPEDVFFVKNLKHTDANLPSLDEAKAFCFEGKYTHSSMAMHAGYKFISSSRLSEVYERHLKNLCSLLLSE